MSRHRDDELPIISDDEQEISNRNSHQQQQQRDNELEIGGCGCCNPRSGVHRFIALVFMCLLGFGESTILF